MRAIRRRDRGRGQGEGGGDWGRGTQHCGQELREEERESNCEVEHLDNGKKAQRPGGVIVKGERQ